MITSLIITAVVTCVLGGGFIAFMLRARKPCKGLWWNTMPQEETYYSDLDKPNGLLRF
jgi:hypothetical protein